MPRYRRSFKVAAATVRRILERHELTQRELGELCGVGARTVARWVVAGAVVDRSLGYIRNSPFSVLNRLSKGSAHKNGSLKSRVRRDRAVPLTPLPPKMS
jgi:hypothetical protein